MDCRDAQAQEAQLPDFTIRRQLPSKAGVLLQKEGQKWFERDVFLEWPTLEIRVRGTTELAYPVDVLHQSIAISRPAQDCLFNGQQVYAFHILSRVDESIISLFAASERDRKDWCSKLRKHSVHIDIENGFQIDGRVLGTGNYASVFLAQDLIEDKQVALKVIEKGRLTKEERQLLADEVVVSKAADNNFCVKTLEFIELGEQYVLVVEYMPGGDLYDRVVCEQYGQVDVKHLFRQLMIGVAHLHSKDLCHRDLKPENFLLTGERPFSVKIADFGIATRVDAKNRNKCLKDGERLRCSPGYGAPEIVRREAYGLPADMWSVGVLLYFMLTGLSPFHGRTKQETLALMSGGKYDRAPLEVHGPAVLDLVTRLLEIDADRRLTAEEALRHPWVCESVLMTVEENQEDEDRSGHGGLPTRLMGAKLEGAFRNPSLHEMSVVTPKDGNQNLLLDVSVHAQFLLGWAKDKDDGKKLPAASSSPKPHTIPENGDGCEGHDSQAARRRPTQKEKHADSSGSLEGDDAHDSDVGSVRSSCESARSSFELSAGVSALSLQKSKKDKKGTKFASFGMISNLMKKVRPRPKTEETVPCGD